MRLPQRGECGPPCSGRERPPAVGTPTASLGARRAARTVPRIRGTHHAGRRASAEPECSAACPPRWFCRPWMGHPFVVKGSGSSSPRIRRRPSRRTGGSPSASRWRLAALSSLLPPEGEHDGYGHAKRPQHERDVAPWSSTPCPEPPPDVLLHQPHTLATFLSRILTPSCRLLHSTPAAAAPQGPANTPKTASAQIMLA